MRTPAKAKTGTGRLRVISKYKENWLWQMRFQGKTLTTLTVILPNEKLRSGDDGKYTRPP